MMAPTVDFYVPAIKWRTGEYQALLKLSDAAKDRIVPLITIPPLEYDFEDGEPKKTVQAHVGSFPKRYKAKWKTRKAWIDVDPSLHAAKMDNRLTVYAHVFEELRKFGAEAVPVSSLDCKAEVIAAIAAIVRKDKKGVAVRTRLEHIMLADFGKRLVELLGRLKVDIEQTDLIVDLGTPAYEPYDVFCGALAVALSKIESLEAYRCFVLIGTAFPDSLKDVAVPGGFVDRHDWKFYRALIAILPSNMRRPWFGDYTIVHPAFTVGMDMRMIKPAGKLVYTAKEQWMIRKGGAFRDNPKQMHDHCDHVVKSGRFLGPAFSSGDEYIALCAQKQAGHSTLTRWKEVGINHHIMHVLEDLAKFGGPP
jgi:hypothetical protein